MIKSKLRYKIEGFLRGDKFLHFATMFFIATLLIHIVPLWVVALMTVFLAIGKEVFDRYEGKEVNYFDILATLLGGVVALLLVCCT